MIATVDIGTMITRSPNIRQGRPRIAGTGITVRRIVMWHKLGWTPQQIADNWGYITLAQVHAALAYYYANTKEIENDLAEEERAADAAEREEMQRRGLAE